MVALLTVFAAMWVASVVMLARNARPTSSIARVLYDVEQGSERR
jgi:hypothetical protein